MFSLSLAVLVNQLYMYSMYPSAVVPPPPPETDRLILCTLYIPVECSEEGLLGGVGGDWDIRTYIISL